MSQTSMHERALPAVAIVTFLAIARAGNARCG